MSNITAQPDSNGQSTEHPQKRRKTHHIPDTTGEEEVDSLYSQSSDFFGNAHHMVFNHPTMIESINMISAGKTVLELLAPYTMPDAAMDSSARDPPPKCHPGTRRQIGNKLETWIDDHTREWDMMWLRGPAGAGKSAVAQTFAEYCSEKGRLGAAFFFSRLNDRNEPKTVIPTLAYQLAVHCRDYNSALTNQVAGDPQLLQKASHVQLKKLIIEPFLTLQTHEHERITEPFVVILDGLDECEGQREQREFVNMINEAAQSKNLPLLWLICSRPEVHLHHTFSKITHCQREELPLDQESRDDVKRYLYDKLMAIKDEYADLVPPSWPPENELDHLSIYSSGLFIFASTGLKYIGDPTYANPVVRLKKLLSFLKNADAIGTNNPLAILDLLYVQVLADIPEEIFPTTWRILAHFIYLPFYLPTADFAIHILYKFLRIDQNAFYSALRKIHSLIAVPAPEDARIVPIRFYHASFADFLLDPNRSGRFAIEQQEACVDIVKASLFWHETDITLFHTNDGWRFDILHSHACLPGLEGPAKFNQRNISREITMAAYFSWTIFRYLSDAREEDLLSQIRDFDFRYISRGQLDRFLDFANWAYRQNPPDPIVRTIPSNEAEVQLLEYLRTVIGQGPAYPAIFPLEQMYSAVDNIVSRRRSYFFVGHGKKTIIVWLTQCPLGQEVYNLNLDKEPSLQQIREYQNWLIDVKWHEAPDETREELGEHSEESSGGEEWDAF